jgi:hypothetical protein
LIIKLETLFYRRLAFFGTNDLLEIWDVDDYYRIALETIEVKVEQTISKKKETPKKKAKRKSLNP